MTTEDFLGDLFYQVDKTTKTVRKHPQATQAQRCGDARVFLALESAVQIRKRPW